MALTHLSLAGDTSTSPSTFGVQLTLINLIVDLLNTQLTSEVLSNLDTTAIDTLVNAVNEVDAKQIPIRMSSGVRKGISTLELAEI